MSVQIRNSLFINDFIKNTVFFKGIFYLLLFLIIYGCSLGDLKTEDNSADTPSIPKTISIEPYVGKLLKVDVQICSETFPFLFDTGGGLTLVDPQITSKLGCAPFGKITGFRMSGERVNFQQCGNTTLTVDSLTIKKEVAVFDLMKMLPDELPPLFGVISLHTFQEHILTLDLSHNRLFIESDESLQKRIQKMKPVNMRIERDMEGRGFATYIEVIAPKGSLWLLLDSGNLKGTILAPHAVEQLELEQNTENGEFNINFSGIGKLITPYHVEDIIHDGVLGIDIMEKVQFSFDFKNEKGWVKLVANKNN